MSMGRRTASADVVGVGLAPTWFYGETRAVGTTGRSYSDGAATQRQNGGVMGLADKAKNKAEELSGKAKEAAGDATDNRDLQAEGQADQASGQTKQAGEHVKDAAGDIKDAFK